MVSKHTPPELITQEEIVSLSRYLTLDDIQRAVKIAKAWQHPYSDHPDCDYYCMLSSVYVAGRIQGIREERAKARGAARKEAANKIK